MDQHERVEDWADTLLEAHRTAPAGSASIEDEPFAEQIQRHRARRAAWAKFQAVEAVVWLIGAALLCGFAYSFLSTF